MKVLKNILSTVIYVLIFAAGIAVAVLLISGMRLYCVQTGSMEPTYPVGSMIVVEKVDAGQLSDGDVVTYSINNGTVVTHRVIGIDKENRLLTTKGDNNDVADSSAVSFENVIGRVKFGIPYVGYAVLMLNTNFGRIMTCVVVVGVAGTAFIIRMYRRPEDDDEDETDSEKL